MALTARGCHLVGNGGFNTSTSFGFKHFIDAEVLFEAPPTALYEEGHALTYHLWRTSCDKHHFMEFMDLTI